MSPADAVCDFLSANVQRNSTFRLKPGEAPLDIAAILGNQSLAPAFVGGVAIACGLKPWFYHHFHSPVCGKIVYAREMGGLYYGTTTDAENYEERRRAVLVIDTHNLGLVAVVAVGYATVSSVHLRVKKGDVVSKGEELGNFAYGGSKVALFFQDMNLSNSSAIGHVDFAGSPVGKMAEIRVGEWIASVGTGTGDSNVIV